MEQSAGLKTEDLSTYLNDHLAGAVGALEHLAKNYPDSTL